MRCFSLKHKGKMSEETIHSRYLNEQMILTIYTPENFSALYKYHICIMQDGNDYFQIGRIARLSDELHANNQITRTIFIGSHYKDKYDRFDKYHPEGKEQQAYQQFLAHEVIPFLDRILPTHSLAQTRMLMGDSLAGTLAFMTALKYPYTFGKVIMQSPYVDQSVLQAIKQTKDLSSLDIYHTIGQKETAVTTTAGPIVDFLTPNRVLNKLISHQKNNYLYHERIDGMHTWKYWQSELKQALITMLT